MKNQKLKNILYPKINELDAFAFWLAITIPSLSYISIVNFLYVINKKFGIFIFFYGAWTFFVLKNVFTRATMPPRDRRIISFFTYYCINYFAVIGSINFMLDIMSKSMIPSFFDVINFFVMFLFLLKSLVSLFILSGSRNENLLVSQIKDKQSNYLDIIILMFVSVIAYFFVRNEQPYLLQVYLIYIYTKIVVGFLTQPK